MARVDRDRRFISWKGMALGALLLIVLFCVALHWVRSNIDSLQTRDTTLQQTVNVMEMDYADLLLQLQRVGSEGYVENAARETYGYIRKGEIVFRFENPELLKGYTQEEYQIIMDEMRD
ncbi:MAG: septum formation initiator family protein [Clostridia bacterium]|nr:septum formation initiator family protein [Clostridia bacterium]MBR6667919.1 septum formation initiator family protein [Clostridia bacterium]